MNSYTVRLGEDQFDVKVSAITGEKIDFIVAGESYSVTVSAKRENFSSASAGAFSAFNSGSATSAGREQDQALKAPMPGMIVSIAKKAGERVEKGEVLAVMEAMKMENDIISPRQGTIDTVKIEVGSQVETGQVLITFKES